MSYDDTYDDEDDEQGEQPQRQGPSPAEIRIWKKKAKQWDESEPQMTRLQRENLLLRDDELRKLDEIKAEALFSVHRGDNTPDALRATATALGWVQPPTPAVPDDERAAHERMNGAVAGAHTVPPPPDINARIQAAQSQAEVLAILNEANGI